VLALLFASNLLVWPIVNPEPVASMFMAEAESESGKPETVTPPMPTSEKAPVIPMLGAALIVTGSNINPLYSVEVSADKKVSVLNAEEESPII
jgi:hypothetical protein